MRPPPPLVLDSSVLIAYEIDTTRHGQGVVAEALAEGRVITAPAISLLVAFGRLGSKTPELSWLAYDPEGALNVLALNLANVSEVGIAADSVDKVRDVETAQVVFEVTAVGGLVLTYEPGEYAGKGVHVVDMRPR